MVKRCLVALVLFAFGGCTSTKLGYEVTTGGWSAYGSSCGGPLSVFEHEIGKGAALQIWVRRDDQTTRLSLTLRLEKAATAQFLESTYQVSLEGAPYVTIELAPFESSLRNFRDADHYLVPPRDFLPTSVLVGEDRFADVPSGFLLGNGDRFTSQLQVVPHALSVFAIRLPPINLNGKRVVVPEASFMYKQITYLQCVQ